MKTKRRDVSMGFTDECFPEGTHMCLIYDNETQRRDVISKFLASGLNLGEQVSYFSDEMEPCEVYKLLQELNVEISSYCSTAFQVLNAGEVYCPKKRFIPEEMIETLRNSYNQAIEMGYPGKRVSGEMSWVFRGYPGSDLLIKYEAMVNDVVISHPVTAICQYDARRFDGATILDVHRVHPMMIVGKKIVENPYYINPSTFLKERGFDRSMSDD